MFIVRLVYVDMTYRDIEFETKGNAVKLFVDTLKSEQDYCKDISKQISTTLRAHDNQIRTLMLLEEVDKEKKRLERYDLQLCLKRTK